MTKEIIAKDIYEMSCNLNATKIQINAQLILAQVDKVLVNDMMLRLATDEVTLQDLVDRFRLIVVREENGATVG